MDETLFREDAFLLSLFNAIPSAMLVVDDDVRIYFGNAAALKLTGASSEKIYRMRGGEVLHCIHATDLQEGCGRGPYCKNCVVRNSVNTAIAGNAVHRKSATMELMKDGQVSEAHLLVTAAPLKYKGETFVLVILEQNPVN